MRRDRSTSLISPQQRALIEEVMEEERLAANGAHKEENIERQIEEGEVIKERERLRRAGSVQAAGLPRLASGRKNDTEGLREEIRPIAARTFSSEAP